MPKTLHFILLLAFWPAVATAHHNPVVYDGKRTVTITGVVTYARFGFPHSRYRIEIRGEDGSTEAWTLMTEDPRDARILGFDDELQALKAGDTITAVGWPNKIRPREIRGHQLRYDDGTVVMMRRGNYIWTDELRRIWRLRDGQIKVPDGMIDVNADAAPAERVTAWIDEAQPIARVAREIVDGSAGLVGIDRGEGFVFPGVREPFECHTERNDFRIEIDASSLDPARRERLEDGSDYIAEYNDLMATYWEYDIGNCP